MIIQIIGKAWLRWLERSPGNKSEAAKLPSQWTIQQPWKFPVNTRGITNGEGQMRKNREMLHTWHIHEHSWLQHLLSDLSRPRKLCSIWGLIAITEQSCHYLQNFFSSLWEGSSSACPHAPQRQASASRRANTSDGGIEGYCDAGSFMMFNWFND